MRVSGVPTQRTGTIYPPGCYGYPGNKIYFQTDSPAKCSSNYPCICATGPVCTETNGNTTNSNACICGGAVCTETTGLFCTSSLSRCSTMQTCPNDDGLTTNSASCLCGDETCTSSTGLFCRSATNACSDSTLFYSKFESGSCASVRGGQNWS